MKKNNNNFLLLLILFFLVFCPNENSNANDKLNFLSLKNNEVNLRIGPSFNYPIKLIYKKKYLVIF